MAADSMKLHILHHGSMHCDLTWLLLKAGVTIAGRADPAMARHWVECPTHTVLIEHPEGNILWDTSCPADWTERWAPTGFQDFFPYDAVREDQLFDNQLHRLGVGLEDIKTVVMSHLHFDHAGNVAKFKGTGARLVCTTKERDGAFGFDGVFQGAHIKADYQDLQFDTVEDGAAIAQGVSIIEAPGHTWGTCSLKVDLPNSGTMIFTSDAVYLRDSWGPPPAAAAIVWDSQNWLSSVEKLRAIAEKTSATVVFGHDAEQIKQVRVAPDGYYD